MLKVETQKLSSLILQEERVVSVSLPWEYEASEEYYPAVYVIDGEMLFNFTAAMVDYYSRIFRIPRMFVVGIENTDRMRDLTPTCRRNREGQMVGGGADKFLEFMEGELFGHLRDTYHVRKYRTIIGHSLGGLLVCHALMAKPLLFNAYMALSPYLAWSGAEVVGQHEQWSGKREAAHRLLFMANESSLRSEQAAQVRVFLDFVRGCDPRYLECEYKVYDASDHMSLPVKAIPDGLDFLFPGFVQER